MDPDDDPQGRFALFPACEDFVSPPEAARLGIDRRVECADFCFNRTRPDYRVRVTESLGFELADLTNKVPVPILPGIVCNYPFKNTNRPDPDEFGLFLAAKYGRVSGLRPRNEHRIETFRGSYRISPTQGVLVHGEDRDGKQEGLWMAARRRGFFANLKLLGPASVFVNPILSVYTDGTMCQIHQRYNLARSVRFAQMLNAVGLPTIVGVACAGDSDQARVAEWFERQGDRVTHLALNAQMRGTSLAQNLRDAQVIERLSGRQAHWTIFGPCRRKSFRQAFEALEPDRVTFVNNTLPHCASAGVDLYGKRLDLRTMDERAAKILGQLHEEHERALRDIRG